MVRFFRDIRKKLIGQRRLNKYFKYAIGEILLVMIGILLALQVNNWNEKRKLTNLQYEVLNELRSALKSDLLDLDGNLDIQSKYGENQDVFIDWIESSEAYHDSLTQYISNGFSTTILAVTKAPYDRLKQIGIGNFKNDSLRNQISKLYELTYPAYHKRSDEYQNLVMELLKLLGEHLSDLYKADKIFIHDVHRIRSDNNLLFQLKILRTVGESLYAGRMLPTKDQIELTLKMIDEELAM